ncbi:MAG TPA: glycosyltransferase family 1 protein [Solirubrobacteraceae bacterium]|nr:glycosyltransferase family 1 protein [Solirubrobacteraceae bacterium]
MRVGFNLIYLMPGRTGGMETVARELIPAIAAERPDWHLSVFAGRDAADLEGPLRSAVAEWITLPVSATNRLEWVAGEQLLLPGRAHRAGIDLLHSLGATAPLRGSFKRVLSIYDFNYKLVPESHNRLLGAGLDVLVRLGAQRSERVIVCSQSTRVDALRLLKIDPARVDSVPLGLGATSAESLEPTPPRELRERFDVGDRKVVLTLSDKRRHKNIVGLVQAAALIAPERRPRFIVVGYSTPHEREVRARIAALGLDGDFRLANWVSDADREGLFALADVFAFPSVYEGFGLPVLEAMARGVPVVCSNAASLPEVAGDAALTFDPDDHQSLATAIERVLFEAGLAERLRAVGRDRAAQFTWARTAQGTIASYERALASSGRS